MGQALDPGNLRAILKRGRMNVCLLSCRTLLTWGSYFGIVCTIGGHVPPEEGVRGMILAVVPCLTWQASREDVVVVGVCIALEIARKREDRGDHGSESEQSRCRRGLEAEHVSARAERVLTLSLPGDELDHTRRRWWLRTKERKGGDEGCCLADH